MRNRPPPGPTRAQLPPDLLAARRWFALAVSVLLVAGLFALILVIGRVPPLDRLFSDPAFFRRGLVVHVDLSLVAWFSCFAAALWFLLPVRGGASASARLSPAVAGLGLLAMCGASVLPDATPILSNYIPALDHPLHLIGLLTFLGGVGLGFVDRRVLPSSEVASGPVALPECVRPGLRALAIAFLLGLLTLFGSALTLPAGLEPEVRYELLYWGVGHVLQFVSVLGMLVAWGLLLTSALGREPWTRRAASLLFGALLLPLFIAPLLAMQGASSTAYRVGFTRLMQWGIFPAVLVFLALAIRAIVRARREGRLPARGLRDGRLLGFQASAALTVAGFVLGALIRGSNTVVPGHYHAAIGAVTASFMAATFVLLEPLGWPLAGRRSAALARWQPVLFGGGQFVFALGFAIAGAAGMARKTYGQEQSARTLTETAGLAVMGLGGLVAVIGGILFLQLVLTAWARAARANAPAPAGRTPWLTTPTSNASPSSRG